MQLSQEELLNIAFKRALMMEEELKKKYQFLAQEIDDEAYRGMFSDFAKTQEKHIDKFKMKSSELNVQIYK